MGVEITPPTITGGDGAVTDTASLYISAAPSATVTGGNYSLWVDAGPSRFDGRVLENKRYKRSFGRDHNTWCDGNYFLITGTTNIDCMTTTGWTAGSMVTLEFVDVLTVSDEAVGCGAGTTNFNVSAAYITTQYDTLTVRYNGTFWMEVSRSVN